ISGWQVSTIVSLSTGPPVNIRVGNNQSRSQAGPDLGERPDLAPGASNNPVLGGPDQYFDTGAFVLQPPGFWGNVARNTLIGPGTANFDLSILKDTTLGGEDTRLEFRAEFFNLLNRPNFSRPASIVFSGGARLGNAGRITNTSTSSRQIQFALKLIF
ncbi:MAG: carboxypeptidase regulatory-like domain-containing protein, partial [Acidobacteria bacterium]|nr:carboxypeptidase regulatory-like domain-containing protein [Acidobacteriota bacterium]